MRAYERLMNYVKVHTTSQDGTGRTPTTERQLDLARMLAEEMRAMGHSRRARGRLRLCVRKPARYARLRKKPGHRLDRPHGYGPGILRRECEAHSA